MPNDTEVRFRELSRSDYDPLQKMISKTWRLEEFYSREIAQKTAQAYLSLYLIRTDFARVAVVNGKTVGLVVVRATANSSVKIKPYLRWWRHQLGLVLNREGREALKFFYASEQVSRQLLQGSPNKYQAELAFLIVDEEYRGLGIGRSLFQQAVGYMQKAGKLSFYLHTDTECNYRFYEKSGLCRRCQTDHTFFLNNRKFEVTFFLYDNL